jgi:hypothetical protein
VTTRAVALLASHFFTATFFSSLIDTAAFLSSPPPDSIPEHCTNIAPGHSAASYYYYQF